MARFTVGAGDQSPLIAQVQASATSWGVVVGIRTSGQGTSGSASRPVLFRPNTVGTPSTSANPEIRSFPEGINSVCTAATAFTSNPTLPTVNLLSANLPIRVAWMCDPADGVVFGLSGAVVLYQNSSGGHLLNGSLTWEDI